MGIAMKDKKCKWHILKTFLMEKMKTHNNKIRVFPDYFIKVMKSEKIYNIENMWDEAALTMFSI